MVLARRGLEILREEGPVRFIQKSIRHIMHRSEGFYHNRIGNGKVTANHKVWGEQQERGIDWHKNNEWRQSKKFVSDTESLFKDMGFKEDQFSGQTMMDLGAGSRMRTNAFFTDVEIIAVEPSASDFMREIEWCDLGEAKHVYSKSAEETIPELKGEIDVIISINALDHGFDFRQSAENILHYLKDDGMAFISADNNKTPDDRHQMVLTDDRCQKIFHENGLVVDDFRKEPEGRYTSDTVLNYWLSPQ